MPPRSRSLLVDDGQQWLPATTAPSNDGSRPRWRYETGAGVVRASSPRSRSGLDWRASSPENQFSVFCRRAFRTCAQHTHVWRLTAQEWRRGVTDAMREAVGALVGAAYGWGPYLMRLSVCM